MDRASIDGPSIKNQNVYLVTYEKGYQSRGSQM